MSDTAESGGYTAVPCIIDSHTKNTERQIAREATEDRTP